MKRLLIALSTLIGVTGTASAADMAVKARPIAAPVPYSWTGCFVGVAGGGGVGRSRHISGDPGTVGFNITNNYDISGGIIGVEYGCNWQTGRWVLGTESDFSWTNIRGGANNIGPFFNTASISNTREHWLSTSRVRAGFLATDQLLLYVTGGLAAARVEALVDATAVAGGIASESRDRWGVDRRGRCRIRIRQWLVGKGGLSLCPSRKQGILQSSAARLCDQGQRSGRGTHRTDRRELQVHQLPVAVQLRCGRREVLIILPRRRSRFAGPGLRCARSGLQSRSDQLEVARSGM
jgi:opacity protein-like surface antigen